MHTSDSEMGRFVPSTGRSIGTDPQFRYVSSPNSPPRDTPPVASNTDQSSDHRKDAAFVHENVHALRVIQSSNLTSGLNQQETGGVDPVSNSEDRVRGGSSTT